MARVFKPSKNEAHKNRVIFSGILVAIMMIGYQNCGKMTSPSNARSLEGSVEQKPALFDLENSSGVTLLKQNNDGLGMYAYKINVATGEVIRTLFEVPENDPVNQPARLCLSESKKDALYSAVASSSVCNYTFPQDPNKACAAIYNYPYAIIQGPNSIYKLGENSSSCSDFVDICEEQRAAFVSTVNYVLQNIDQSKCN